MLIEKIFIGRNSVNTYLVGDKNGRVAVIDPGSEPEKIYNKIEELGINIDKIINTHGHFDHIGGNKYLKTKYNADIYIHKSETDFLTDPSKNLSSLLGTEIVSPPGDKFLEEGNFIKLGSNEFEVLYTPGHSPGGISLYNHEKKIVFSGDTIFKMGIGRADFPTSDKKELYDSIENKLLVLDNDVVVYPGHGAETTIGEFSKMWKRIKS